MPACLLLLPAACGGAQEVQLMAALALGRPAPANTVHENSITVLTVSQLALMAATVCVCARVREYVRACVPASV